MTVLVVGGGGREHALVRKIKESPRVDSVHCCPGNGGIAYDAVCHNVAAMDIDGVVALAKEIKADLVVVAPDDPLVAGMVDALNAAGFATFGPRANAAIIEGSKVFSKDLMQKYHIPTAEYRVFDDPRAAIEYITEKNEFPTVIKADGLALGKGVLIPETLEEAVAGVKEIMEDKVFGASGNHIVVEEFLTGPEVSVLAFTDGKCVRPMVSSMDHKRALDGDKGLNTGGMGTVSPNPYYTEAVAQQCMDTIFLPTIAAMNAEGRTFQGCLYFGLMLTPKGPKVIEYNCRFGDPETQVVLPLLDGDVLLLEPIGKLLEGEDAVHQAGVSLGLRLFGDAGPDEDGLHLGVLLLDFLAVGLHGGKHCGQVRQGLGIVLFHQGVDRVAAGGDDNFLAALPDDVLILGLDDGRANGGFLHPGKAQLF